VPIPRPPEPSPDPAAPLALFASAAPGVEEILARELQALGADAVTPLPGGVAFAGDRAALYRANLWLRSAERVLRRVATFRARDFTALRKRAARIDWAQYLGPEDALSLRVTCHKSRLHHSGAVAERVLGAMQDRLGFAPQRVAPADEDAEAAADAAAGPGPRVQRVVVRIAHDDCTLSVDASGDGLHRRGYRQQTGRAPLRETLAAALLLAAGWDRRSPLVDPFCGAGTIAIEAGLLARDLAPGRQRRFAFEAWRDFDAALWKGLLRKADVRAARAPAPPPIVASDRDAGAIAAARANAARAGVAADIAFAQRALSALVVPPGPGFVVTNPPHGVRLRGGDLRDLYARFGQVLRARCPGWQVALLSAGTRLHAASGLPLAVQGTLLHGGLRLAWSTGRVPEPE
jgi:putative N6-adenine-specific DNA methylase